MNSSFAQADAPPWVVCQLGAREHYAVARALHARGRLAALVTDVWTPPGSTLLRISPRVSQRHHADLADARVCSWNLRAFGFELRSKVSARQGWAKVMARNAHFQRRAGAALESIEAQLARGRAGASPPTLFCYSYAARSLLQWARDRGWRTVLGQIDGGFQDSMLIKDASQPLQMGEEAFPPPEYWQHWREEVELADEIVVNSDWSRKLLEREGVAAGKLRIVPLAYTPTVESLGFIRCHPSRFDATRPLRVLFLGTVGIRKGAVDLLQAARKLLDAPVEFSIVGPETAPVPEELRALPNVRWFGPVPRESVGQFYRSADVFMFPTHSDGFGLTQLEAQAWKLPVIASTRCGNVVESGVNGLLLAEVSVESISAAIRQLLANPSKLGEWAANAVDFSRYSLEAIGRDLLRDQ